MSNKTFLILENESIVDKYDLSAHIFIVYFDKAAVVFSLAMIFPTTHFY